MTVTKQTKHGVIIVDECDADLLARAYAWKPQRCNSFYALTRNPAIYLLHRAIMSRMLSRSLTSKEQIDHANNDGLDNRRSNLRIATPSQNNANKPLGKTNTSGFKGVNWQKTKNKWRAEIKVNHVRIHLGYFTDPAEAHDAYMRAAVAYFGEFANSGKTGQLDLFATNEDKS